MVRGGQQLEVYLWCWWEIIKHMTLNLRGSKTHYTYDHSDATRCHTWNHMSCDSLFYIHSHVTLSGWLYICEDTVYWYSQHNYRRNISFLLHWTQWMMPPWHITFGGWLLTDSKSVTESLQSVLNNHTLLHPQSTKEKHRMPWLMVENALIHPQMIKHRWQIGVSRHKQSRRFSGYICGK